MNDQPVPQDDPDHLGWQGFVIIAFVFLLMASCWLMYAGGKL